MQPPSTPPLQPPTLLLLLVTDNCAANKDEEPSDWSYAVGILLGASASVGINVGNNVMALGLAEQAASGSEKRTHKFWVGTSVFATASILNFVAFGFAVRRPSNVAKVAATTRH